MGLENAATRRADHARTMASMRANVDQLIRYMVETWRDPMLVMHEEVATNADGEYEDGDLESVNAACREMRRRLRELADSFTPAP